MLSCNRILRTLSYAFGLVLLITAQTILASSSGTLRGKVMDSDTKDALPGATILVKGTSIGAATDINGTYVIYNVPTGDQTLVVSYVGYVQLTTQVTVDANAETPKDFFLTPQAVTTKNVIVTAQAFGQMQSINQQLAANQIVNVVSAEKMKELPDANIAESIGRLPGISVQRNEGEADAVVIRGLSPKYNEITIEGIPMSSTNYADRSIDLSLIGDDLVKGVEVRKTLTPDMDADALGGTVNLTLKTADPGLHYDLWGNGGYNNIRSSYANYKFAATGGDRFFNNHLGVLLQGNIEEKQLPSDQFSAGYGLMKSQTLQNTFYINTNSAVVTDDDIQRHRYGASLILDYTTDLVDVKFFNVYDQKNDSTISRVNTSYFNNSSFQDQIFVNETKTIQETHSLQALFKVAGTELPISFSYTKGQQQVPNGLEFDFIQQLTGTPLSQNALIYAQPSNLMRAMGVMDPASSIYWDDFVSNTNLTDNSYDAKVDWKIPFKLSESFSGELSVGGKYHDVNRTSNNTRFWYDLQWGGSHGRIVNFVNDFPSLTGANTNLVTGGIQGTYFVDPGYAKTSILGYPIGPQYDPYLLSDMENAIYPAWKAAFYTDGPGSYNQNYTDKENSQAGYVMGEFNIGSDLTIVPGVRYQEEQTDISAYHVRLNGSNANGLDGPAPVLVDTKRDNPYWYPSVNIKYKATDNIQVIGAIYRSVSLPSFADISPAVDLDDGASSWYSGNPLLKPSTAWNYDLGTSVYSNDIGLFTVDFFYKDMSNLIYYLQNFFPFYPYPIAGAPADLSSRLPARNYYDTTWVTNASRSLTNGGIPINDPSNAYLRGVEFSWQTHFWYFPGVLSGLVLDVNLSLMSSNQQYPYFQPLTNRFGTTDTLQYATKGGPLQDQPKAVYNAILGWDYKGFSSRFSASYQQLTLSSLDLVYPTQLRNSYIDNIFLVDISLKQQIISNLSIFANATNINGHVDNNYFSHPTYTPSATSTYPAGNLPTNQQTYGWAAQFGLTFNY